MRDNKVSWKDHIDSIFKKTLWRIYVQSSQVFWSEKTDYFIMSVIMSVLQYCNSKWYQVSACLLV